MAKSPPSSPFYWNDYYRDTRLLSPTARGIWMDILCLLHESGRRGKMTLKMDQWLRWCTCPQEVFEQSLKEIEEEEVGDVTFCHRDVTLYVTVENRRMSREEKARNSEKMRQQKHRCHGPVTPPVTGAVTGKYMAPSSSSSSSSSSSGDKPSYSPLPDSDGKISKTDAKTILNNLSPRLREVVAGGMGFEDDLESLKEPHV